MAVLVAQDEHDLIRRVPASGDGGIDLLLPRPDGYAVLQVKGFVGRIGSGERRQLEHSIRTTMTNPRLERPILSYGFVVPTDLTPNEQAWFDSLVVDAPWPTSWLGIPYWDSLAASHKHVIDYMIEGGAERVRNRSRVLGSLQIDPSEPLLPADAAELLGGVQRQLDADDPHFRYELALSATPPDREAANGAAMMTTRSVSGGGFLTVKVVPKHRYSLEDAPIQGTLTIRIDESEDGQALQEQFEAFELFGRDLAIPDGRLSFDIDAPGGLGGSATSAGGQFISSSTVEHEPLRLVMVLPDGAAVAELEVAVTNVTAGSAAAEVHLKDSSGLFTARMLVPNPAVPDAPSSLTFHLEDPAGRPVLEVLPALRLMADHGQTHLQVRPRYGNSVLGTAKVGPDQLAVSKGTLHHLEDLAFLQGWAEHPLLVPSEVDPPQASELSSYARMLRGEVLTGTWTSLAVNLTAPRSDVPNITGDTGALLLIADVTFSHSEGEVALGQFSSLYANASLADVQPADETKAVFVPNGESTFTRSAGNAAESGWPEP
jgi:hypothetical protein